MADKKHSSPLAARSEMATVSDVGTGADARKVVRVGSWELTAWTVRGDEPLIRDIDLAERLGYERAVKVRDLIKSLILRGKLNDVAVFPAAVKTSGGRPAVEFWLTESQALKVAAKSETEPADALLDEMIRVFMLARRGLLPQQQTAADLAARDVMVAMASEVVSQMVAPILKQFSKLSKALDERAEGLITPQQVVDLKREIGIVARDYYDLGDYETIKAAKAAIHQHVMAASEWGGTGRTRWAMPAGRYAVALATLRALRTAAERRARRAKKVHVPPKGQLSLPVGKPN